MTIALVVLTTACNAVEELFGLPCLADACGAQPMLDLLPPDLVPAGQVPAG